MVHEPIRTEHMELHYELAMAIGTSLELGSMLKIALSTFLRKLSCSAGGIYHCDGKTDTTTPLYSIPHDVIHNRACQVVREILPHAVSPVNFRDFCATLPQNGGNPVDGFYHILKLPDFGFLILVRHDAELDPLLLNSLEPLLVKLASASKACLQNEELKQTYRRISLERNMLRTLIDYTPIVAFAIDRDGIFTMSEGFGLQALGLKPHSVVGQSIFDLYKELPIVTENVRMALGGESRAFTVQHQGLSYDGYLTPVFDESDIVNGVVGVAHDITERQSAQKILESVLNTAGEGIVAMDVDGAILMANREIERIFGYDQDFLLQTTFMELFAPHERPLISNALLSFRELGESSLMGQRLEMEGLRANQQQFPLEIHVTETRVGARVLFTASLRDITQRIELDTMRDEFISNISHELRTPLASIMGWTETLLSERPGPLTDLQRRFLTINYKSSQRLNALVEEILTVSRIQHGTLQLELRPMSPSTVMQGALEAVKTLAEAKAIQIDVDDEWSPAETIAGDAYRLEQVIENMLSNAIKFSPTGGRVILQSRQLQSEWIVEVSDHGIGIPADEQAMLFQRFYRASNAAAAQIQGTGLGLFLCRAIIEEHGGYINLESKENLGTTVLFSIPVQKQRGDLIDSDL